MYGQNQNNNYGNFRSSIAPNYGGFGEIDDDIIDIDVDKIDSDSRLDDINVIGDDVLRDIQQDTHKENSSFSVDSPSANVPSTVPISNSMMPGMQNCSMYQQAPSMVGQYPMVAGMQYLNSVPTFVMPTAPAPGYPSVYVPQPQPQYWPYPGQANPSPQQYPMQPPTNTEQSQGAVNSQNNFTNNVKQPVNRTSQPSINADNNTTSIKSASNSAVADRTINVRPPKKQTKQKKKNTKDTFQQPQNKKTNERPTVAQQAQSKQSNISQSVPKISSNNQAAQAKPLQHFFNLDNNLDNLCDYGDVDDENIPYTSLEKELEERENFNLDQELKQVEQQYKAALRQTTQRWQDAINEDNLKKDWVDSLDDNQNGGNYKKSSNNNDYVMDYEPIDNLPQALGVSDRDRFDYSLPNQDIEISDTSNKQNPDTFEINDSQLDDANTTTHAEQKKPKIIRKLARRIIPAEEVERIKKIDSLSSALPSVSANQKLTKKTNDSSQDSSSAAQTSKIPPVSNASRPAPPKEDANSPSTTQPIFKKTSANASLISGLDPSVSVAEYLEQNDKPASTKVQNNLETGFSSNQDMQDLDKNDYDMNRVAKVCNMPGGTVFNYLRKSVDGTIVFFKDLNGKIYSVPAASIA